MNKGQFDGSKPGPGRPKGGDSGRAVAVAALDRVLARAKNRKALDQALQAEFDRDPVKFFIEVVVPLMPRRALAASQTDTNGVRWTSILETFPAGGDQSHT
jgi:hypothetical protein